jgi:hypothetical protein
MSRGSILRAVLALFVAVAAVGLSVSQAGFLVVAGAIGVRVGSPGASVELTRALLPIVVALLGAVLAVRFGIRALRYGETVRGDFSRGGKLLAVTAWAAWVWLVVELSDRQLYLGWATLFGDLGRSLAWSATAVAVAIVIERLVPWSRGPRGVRHLGLSIVAAVAVMAALSAWSHRGVVSKPALLPVALAGLVLLISGVRRVEAGPRGQTLVELALSSLLLSGPLWSLFS